MTSLVPSPSGGALPPSHTLPPAGTITEASSQAESGGTWATPPPCSSPHPILQGEGGTPGGPGPYTTLADRWLQSIEQDEQRQVPRVKKKLSGNGLFCLLT